MKKLFSLTLLLFLLVFPTWGAETVAIDNGVLLTPTEFGYTIEFTMGNYTIINDETRWDKEEDEDNGIFCDSLYSYILFDEEDDIYDYWDEDGLPEIPYYSLTLHTFYDGYNAIAPSNIKITDASYNVIKLDHLYLPHREITEDEDDCTYWDINTDFYFHGYENERFLREFTMGETYGYHEYGASVVHLHPIMYFPRDSTLIILEYATIEVTFPPYDYIDLMCDTIIENYTRHYDAITFFDYYQNIEFVEQVPAKAPPFTQYIILTTRDLYMCDEFITTKEELQRYNTAFYFANEDFENTPEEIYQFLYNKYIDSEKNLKYVLIIGGSDIIPYSAGEANDMSNPPTDWWYGCLNSPSMYSSPLPTIYVGRWPVINRNELSTIMYKTLEAESYIYTGSVSLFSGTGSGEKKFYRINRWVSRHVFSQLGVIINNYDGRKFTSIADAQSTMLNQIQNGDWMMIYRGHGSTRSFGSPYNITSSSLKTHFQNNNSGYCPIGFGIACSLNDFTSYNCIGHQLLCGATEGTAIFYGATTPSDRTQNNKLEKRIFKYLKKNSSRNLPIGQWIINAAWKYYTGAISTRSKTKRCNHMQKYVLFGDPSFRIKGINALSSQRQTPKYQHLYIEPSDSSVPIKTIQIFGVDGQLICNGSHIENLPLSTLPIGVYIVSVEYLDGQHTTQKHIINL